VIIAWRAETISQAPAGQVDREDVRGGEDRARAARHRPGRGARVHVDREGGVDLRLPIEQALLDQDARSPMALLAGLEDQLHVPGELGPLLGEETRGPRQHRDVGVVAAGMHPPGVLRGEVEARVLLEGQSVHVGAQQDRRAGAAPSKGRDHGARPAPRGDLEIEALEGLQHRTLGLGQLETQLGPPMDPAPQGDDLGKQALRIGQQRGQPLRHATSSGCGQGPHPTASALATTGAARGRLAGRSERQYLLSGIEFTCRSAGRARRVRGLLSSTCLHR
jgi:hypothetical protein